MQNFTGVFSLLAAGMCLGFFVSTFILLGHYERQTGRAFSQADPNWRFHSIFGALMLCIGVQCLAYGLFARGPDPFATKGMIDQLINGKNSFFWLCFAFGLVPTPVLMLELIYSRAYQQIGFTRFYEENAKRWPALGKEISWLRSDGAPPARPPLSSLKHWLRWLWLQSIYILRFLLVWQFIYYWSSLANLILEGHYFQNKKALASSPKFLRTSQSILDILVGFTVAVSLASVVMALCLEFGWFSTHLRFYGSVLFLGYFLLVLAAFSAALYPSGSANPTVLKRLSVDAVVAIVFIITMTATLYIDWFFQADIKTYLNLAPITLFGGYLPLVLTVLALYLVTLFIDEWNTASVRYQTQVQRSIGVNFRNQILHAFNNKMNAPLGLVEQIDEHLKRDDLHTAEGLEVLRSQAETAKQALNELRNFVDDFKTQARLESAPRYHRLDELLKKHATPLSGQLQPTIELPQGYTIQLKVEERAFDQAMQNLIENAHFALTSVRTQHPELRIHASFRQNDTFPLTIEVSDNGPGIAADIVHKLFEMNFTTKANGTGIGLYQVKDFMERLGGEVELEAQGVSAEQGAIFILRFPQDVVDAAHQKF